MKKYIFFLVFFSFVAGWVNYNYPIESKSNNLIVFSRNINKNWDIWVYDLHKNSLQQITHSPEDEINPLWLKEKNNIAFIRGGNIFLYQNNFETKITEQGNYRFLSYNHKTQKLLFSKYNLPEDSELGYYDLLTEKEGVFFTQPRQQIHPKSSMDGEIICYSEGYSVEFVTVVQEICFFYTRTGKSETIIKKEKTAFYRPALSPDGKKLAFISNQNKQIGLYVKDLSSGSVQKISGNSPYYDFPCWREDGQEILFTTLAGNELKLAIYNFQIQKSRIIAIPGDCKEADW